MAGPAVRPAFVAGLVCWARLCGRAPNRHWHRIRNMVGLPSPPSDSATFADWRCFLMQRLQSHASLSGRPCTTTWERRFAPGSFLPLWSSHASVASFSRVPLLAIISPPSASSVGVPVLFRAWFVSLPVVSSGRVWVEAARLEAPVSRLAISEAIGWILSRRAVDLLPGVEWMDWRSLR